MSLRLGLAYPLARRGRTALILAMYSLVVFTLTFITVLNNLFSTQIDSTVADASGGAEVRVTSNPTNPIPVNAVSAQSGVNNVVALSDDVLQYRADPNKDFALWPTTAFDANIRNGGAPTLSERAETFTTDEAVFRDVANSKSKAIVSEFFLQDGGGPPAAPFAVGDTFTARDPLSGKEQQFEVAGVLESGFGDFSTFISQDAYRDLVGPRAAINLLAIDLAPTVPVEQFVDSLNGGYIANGAKAESYRSIVETGLSQNRQFFQLMQGYLALGLIVGIAGLGVVMVRAVRERRRQIGVLRSLGFQSRSVGNAFLTEASFVALEGIVIGVALSIAVAWRMSAAGEFGDTGAFSVPWIELGIWVAGAFVVSLLATFAPARQASAIRPAVALRITD